MLQDDAGNRKQLNKTLIWKKVKVVIMSDNHSLIKIKSIAEEPYVFLEDGKHMSNWDKEKEIIYNQQLRQKAKVEFYRNAFEFLYAHSIEGDYFEFGCHKVRTFRMALTEARKKNMHNMMFYAFDTFEGLPDFKDNSAHNVQYRPELLSTGEEEFLSIIKQHNIYVDKVKTIKGRYEDILVEGFKKDFKSKGIKIALVTLDCSLYQSFVTTFNFIEDFLQEGSLLYIDDYRVTYKGSPILGVPKAFNEFKKKSAFEFEPFLDVGWFGKSFISYKL